MRLGAADASSAPTGTSTRSYYDTMADAFGKGFDAPLLLVAQTPDSSGPDGMDHPRQGAAAVQDIASVGPPAAVSGSSLSTIQVFPTTSSQDQATSDLVRTLRSAVIPRAEAGTGLRVYVGGTTATNIDYLQRTDQQAAAVPGRHRRARLPAPDPGVPQPARSRNRGHRQPAHDRGRARLDRRPVPVGLGAAAVRHRRPGPLEYTVAILIVGVVFGLSMDYHVFLVSRMHERWTQTGDNRRAVTGGVADTGGVIVTAAAIMACVFASFGLAGVRTISEFGVGLAVAVLADAFLLRMTVVPALMHLIGQRNWAIPSWLDRALPRVSVESPGTDSPAHPAGEHRKPAAVNAP